MRKKDLDEKYFVWLSRLVGVEKNSYSYWEMFRVLYTMKFTWFIPNDDNREVDGKLLRIIFCESLDIEFSPRIFKEHVSVLEVFIGICTRLARIMEDQEGGVTMDLKYWFWHLITNINLAGTSDSVDNNESFKAYIIQNIQKVLDRTYEKNGQGGLFPLKFDKKDQRKEEIWYQMSKYLMENYYGDLLKV